MPLIIGTDRILAIDRGIVAAVGIHDEFTSQRGLYYYLSHEPAATTDRN